jgi:uncharacterized membrane protein
LRACRAADSLNTEVTISEDAVPEETLPADTPIKVTVPEETLPADTPIKVTVPEETLPADTAIKVTVPEEFISEAACTFMGVVVAPMIVVSSRMPDTNSLLFIKCSQMFI